MSLSPRLATRGLGLIYPPLLIFLLRASNKMTFNFILLEALMLILYPISPTAAYSGHVWQYSFLTRPDGPHMPQASLLCPCHRPAPDEPAWDPADRRRGNSPPPAHNRPQTVGGRRRPCAPIFVHPMPACLPIDSDPIPTTGSYFHDSVSPGLLKSIRCYREGHHAKHGHPANRRAVRRYPIPRWLASCFLRAITA